MIRNRNLMTIIWIKLKNNYTKYKCTIFRHLLCEPFTQKQWCSMHREGKIGQGKWLR